MLRIIKNPRHCYTYDVSFNIFGVSYGRRTLLKKARIHKYTHSVYYVLLFPIYTAGDTKIKKSQILSDFNFFYFFYLKIPVLSIMHYFCIFNYFHKIK